MIYFSFSIPKCTISCPYRAPSYRLATSIHVLTPWCRVLLDKPLGLELFKKLPAFHGTRMFITALTSIRHLPLSWVGPIQSIYLHPTSWRSVLILFTHLRLGLPIGLFPSCFPTKTVYPPLSLPKRATYSADLSNQRSIHAVVTGTDLSRPYVYKSQ